jgi:hypothetical protein
MLVLLLVLFFVTSCGQPLVTTPSRATRTIGPTPARTASTTPAPAIDGTTQLPSATATEPVVAPPATLAPTVQPTPSATPNPTSAVIITPQLPSQTNEQRWRAQEQDRQVFDPPRLYTTQSPVTLQWYDPVTGQVLAIGTLFGTFPVQAQFVLRDGNRPALEVPYRINGDFGLTAISDAVVQRMHAAGYTESVEAFVLQDEAIQPK